MRIAEVIGTVTLSRPHPSFKGASLKLIVPMNLEQLADDTVSRDGDSIVAWDEYGAGQGDLIAVAEGPEASQPFRPEPKAVDAYIAALLDDVQIKIGPEELKS